MFADTLAFHRAFFQFLNPSDKNEFSDLVSRRCSPFKFAAAYMWKITESEIGGNGAMKIASPRLFESLLMMHFSFRVFDVNWLAETLRKSIQS